VSCRRHAQHDGYQAAATLLGAPLELRVGRHSLNSRSNVSRNRNRRKAAWTGLISRGGSSSRGPIQYRPLSPSGSFTTHLRSRKTNENRSSLNQLRRIVVTPSTDLRTCRMGPNDHQYAFEISKWRTEPFASTCGYVLMTPNATGLTGRRHAQRDGNRAAPLLGGPVEALVGRHRLPTPYIWPRSRRR